MQYLEQQQRTARPSRTQLALLGAGILAVALAVAGIVAMDGVLAQLLGY